MTAPLDPAAVAGYVRSGEPMDKAGAYGIQGLGALMVAGVDGCYFNVMGLPLARLGAGLREIVVAAVVLNQVIGPVLFKHALGKAGEIPEA